MNRRTPEPEDVIPEIDGGGQKNKPGSKLWLQIHELANLCQSANSLSLNYIMDQVIIIIFPFHRVVMRAKPKTYL